MKTNTKNIIAIVAGVLFFAVLFTASFIRQRKQDDVKPDEPELPSYILIGNEDTEMSRLNLVGKWENLNNREARIEFFDDGTYQAEGDFSNGTYEVHEGYAILTSTGNTTDYLRFVRTEAGIVIQRDMRTMPYVYGMVSEWTPQKEDNLPASEVPPSDDEVSRMILSAILEVLNGATWDEDFADAKLQKIFFSDNALSGVDVASNSNYTAIISVRSAGGNANGYFAVATIDGKEYDLVIEFVGEFGDNGYILKISNTTEVLAHARASEPVMLTEPS